MQRVQLPQRSAAMLNAAFLRYRQRGHDHAQQQPRAKLLIEHTGILPDPADAAFAAAARSTSGPVST